MVKLGLGVLIVGGIILLFLLKNKQISLPSLSISQTTQPISTIIQDITSKFVAPQKKLANNVIITQRNPVTGEPLRGFIDGNEVIF